MTLDLTEFRMATVIDEATSKPMPKMCICGDGNSIKVDQTSNVVKQMELTNCTKRMGYGETLKAIYLYNNGEVPVSVLISVVNGGPITLVSLDVGKTAVVELYDMFISDGINITVDEGTAVFTLISRK